MGSTPLSENFELAPGYRVKDWNSLKLNEERGDTADWNNAIKILNARICTRFIEPAQFLIDSENGKSRGTYGFAVLAIDFLLIETLQGFRSGCTNHEGHSKALFKDFLKAWPAFTSCVPPDKTPDKLASNVYEQGRCALHHTGSTDRIVVRRSGKKIFVFHDDGRIEINRTLLHCELTKKFDSYLDDLKALFNKELRKNFKTKMDYICSL